MRLLSRTDVQRLLTPQACMAAVEDAFRRHVIFDSTRTGLQDVAAAIATYRQSLDANAGTQFNFSQETP